MKCRLKVIFAERNIKQKDFAKEHEFRLATLNQYINGKITPSLEVAYRIADILGLSVEEIWVKEGEKK